MIAFSPFLKKPSSSHLDHGGACPIGSASFKEKKPSRALLVIKL